MLSHRLVKIRNLAWGQWPIINTDFVYRTGKEVFVRPAGTRVRIAFLIVRRSDRKSDFRIGRPETGRELGYGSSRSVEIEFERSCPFHSRHVMPGVVVAGRFGSRGHGSFRTVVIEVGHASVGILNDRQAVSFSKIPAVSVHENLSVTGRIVLIRFKPGRVGSFVAHVQCRDFPYGHVSAVRERNGASEFPRSSRRKVRSAESSGGSIPALVRGGISRNFVKIPVSGESASSESGFQRRSGSHEASRGAEFPNVGRIRFQYVHGSSRFLDGQRSARIEKHPERVSGGNDRPVGIIRRGRVGDVRPRRSSGFQEGGKLREISVSVNRVRHRHVRIRRIRSGFFRNSQSFRGVSSYETLVRDNFSGSGELCRLVRKRIRAIADDRQFGAFLQEAQIRRSRRVPRIGGISRERHEPHRSEYREHGDYDDEFGEGEAETRFRNLHRHFGFS